jgi:hypothetical protein
MSVLSKDNYANGDIASLRCIPVREYDMEDAGFSIVKMLNLFPSKTEYLSSIPKRERNIAIGMAIKSNPEAGKAIQAELKRVRLRFAELNGIEDHEVLSVRRDAVFLIKRRAESGSFEGYTFRLKSQYSSFYRVNGVDLLYSSKDDTLDVKGIGAESRRLHGPYLLDGIRMLAKSAESNSQEQALRVMREYRAAYLDLRLPVGTYRELNSSNMFRSRVRVAGNAFYMNSASDADLRELDVTHNYIAYLGPLLGLMV